jgi:hypothetical protein
MEHAQGMGSKEISGAHPENNYGRGSLAPSH